MVTQGDSRPFSPFDPDRLAFRLLMLVGICFLTFGSYFVYDIPAALQDALTAVDFFYLFSRYYSVFFEMRVISGTFPPFSFFGT